MSTLIIKMLSCKVFDKLFSKRAFHFQYLEEE